MGQITNPQIQLLLSIKVGRQNNLTLDKMKYEFSKPSCQPSKTDFGSDEEWATDPFPYFVAPQLTNETECQMKVCIKGIL